MICKVKWGGNQGSDRKDPNKQTQRREKAKSCTTHSRKHTHTHTHIHRKEERHTKHTRRTVWPRTVFPFSLSSPMLQLFKRRHRSPLRPPTAELRCWGVKAQRQLAAFDKTRAKATRQGKKRKKLFSLPGTRIDFLTRFGWWCLYTVDAMWDGA